MFHFEFINNTVKNIYIGFVYKNYIIICDEHGDI